MSTVEPCNFFKGWKIPSALNWCHGYKQSLGVIISRSPVKYGSRGRDCWSIFRLIEAKDSIRGIHSDSLLTNSQHENADALLGFPVASFFHNLSQQGRADFVHNCGLRCRLEYTFMLCSLPTLPSQVPENEISGSLGACAISIPVSPAPAKGKKNQNFSETDFVAVLLL